MAINEGRNRIDSLTKEMDELVAMKKASLDRQKTIDGRVKQIQAERKDHSKLSMAGQTLDAEKTALNEERKEGVDQRKVWDGKVVEIKQAISAETKALKGARTRDSRPPTTPRKDRVASSQHHHEFPNSPQTPTRHAPTFSKSPRPFATPLTSKAPFNTVDPSSGPSRLDFPRRDAFGGDDLGADYEHNDNNYDHNVNVEATAASSSTPRRNEGRLEPHLIPFNPTPSKLAVIEAFDRENHDGFRLSDAELDKLLDLNFWQ